MNKINDYKQYGTDVERAIYYPSGKVRINYKHGGTWYGDGEFFGEAEGYGYYKNREGVKTQEGMWKDDLLHGSGKLFTNGMVTFDGLFKKGKREGFGIEYYLNGAQKYVGLFKNNNRHGKGVKYFDDGKTIKFDGSYEKSFKEGEGIEYYPDSRVRFEGIYGCGDSRLKGRYTFEDDSYCILNRNDWFLPSTLKIYDSTGSCSRLHIQTKNTLILV